MNENLKKIFSLLFVIIVCLIGVPVYAWQTGGYTGGGGSAGGGTSINAMTDGGSGFDSGVYLFQLVYRPQNKNYYQVGKCVVINTGSQGRYRIADIDRKARSTADSNGCTYGGSNGSLLNLAKQIQNKGGLDNVPVVSEKEYAKQLVSEFGADYDNLNLSGSTPGTYNSYGYRILVQKLTCFGYSSSNLSTWCAVLWPRKSWAAQNPSLGLFGGSFQGDLYTTVDDIGIRNAANRRNGWYSTTGNGSELGRAFADVNRGEGYNIIGFDESVFVPNYDYSIDAACVNCNSNDADNKTYIIQDILDWEAIFASSNVENKKIKNYYHKGNGVYCREEYIVYFPNTTNTIYVEPGRYFTLNPSAKALDKIISSAAIPNMKPVRVVKKRQCRVNTEKNSSNSTTVLDSFRRKSEYDFKGKTGTVSFKYNERYEDSRYNMDDMEELSVYDEPNNYTYSINNGTLNMEVTRYYTLPSNYYQYIRKQDGLSMKVKPSTNLGYYINVGISNLPVSFNNTGDNGIAADIQFLFELPTNDQYSKLDEAYIENNSYLLNQNSEGNIYKRYKAGKLHEGENIENSACAKMFGVGNQNFKTCVDSRQNNSIGDIDKNANCIVNSKITTSAQSGYSCIVLTPKETDDCSSEDDANRLGLDWNPYNQTCCPVGTTYNPTLGKCESNNETCRIENGKYYDFDGNEITKEEYDRICPNSENGDTCRIENGKYYDFDGNEITKEEYDRICPSNLPPTCETDGDCPYGCCPSGECAPMPDGTCPGSGGIDVIYRTIDLVNPFPGQNAEQRNTGANWCSYNIRTQKIDCKYNNQTVKNYITREKGGTEHGGEVYREDHVLYEVTLDSSTIGQIRDYNDDHKYDDWLLNCYNEEDSKVTNDSRVTYGRACKSEFLRDYLGSKVSGKCASSTNSNFYTCDEDV